MGARFLSAVLLAIILCTILLIKGQSFLKMDLCWMDAIGDLLIHRIGECHFFFQFPFGFRQAVNYMRMAVAYVNQV